jgi:hypothetical protein
MTDEKEKYWIENTYAWKEWDRSKCELSAGLRKAPTNSIP